MTIEEFELSLKNLTIVEQAIKLAKFYSFIATLARITPEKTVKDSVNSFLNTIT